MAQAVGLEDGRGHSRMLGQVENLARLVIVNLAVGRKLVGVQGRPPGSQHGQAAGGSYLAGRASGAHLAGGDSRPRLPWPQPSNLPLVEKFVHDPRLPAGAGNARFSTRPRGADASAGGNYLATQPLIKAGPAGAVPRGMAIGGGGSQ